MVTGSLVMIKGRSKYHVGTPWLGCSIVVTICSSLFWISGTVADSHLLVSTSIAGILVLGPITRVATGEEDMFSPSVIVALLMFIGMYVAPLTHVALDRYPAYLALPTDMAGAIAKISSLNIVAASVYTASYFASAHASPLGMGGHVVQSIDPFAANIRRNLSLLGFVSMTLFIGIIIQSGGPSLWLESQLHYRTLSTSGWVLALAEAFPRLFFFSYCITLHSKGLPKRVLARAIIWALLFLVLLTFVSSGLRGSRANFVWPVLSGLIFVHLLLGRIRRSWAISIGLILAVFAGAYDIYKKAGPEALGTIARTGGNFGDIDSSQFGWASLILSDFSRTGVQAVLLDVWNSGSQALGYGLSYVGDFLLFIPWIGSDSPIPNKTMLGSDWLYGPGAAAAGELSTRIFGLQGEALMNFGTFGFIMILVPFGVLIGRCRKWYANVLNEPNVRSALCAAILVPALGLAYVSDLDNVFRYATSNMLLPLLALWGIRRKSTMDKSIRRAS